MKKLFEYSQSDDPYNQKMQILNNSNLTERQRVRT
jgi:hypothetical protein